MKKTVLASAVSFALSAAFLANFAHADDVAAPAAAAAPAADAKPDNEVSFNAALTTDYRYRGISQTRLQPALQGGADYTNNPTGFYLGTWGSTIKWIKDAGGNDNVEIDIYGGKRGEIVKDVSYDIGVLSYVYPSNALNPDANTTEIYGQLGYGPAYIKYSNSVTNLFGFANSKNSGYLDIGANVDLAPTWVLNLHVGRQNVKNNSVSSYTDWKIGVTKDFGVVTGALAVFGTNADQTAYANPVNGKFMGKTALVASVSKTF
jgi:uncharacterized protein (TIGR02001 family)